MTDPAVAGAAPVIPGPTARPEGNRSSWGFGEGDAVTPTASALRLLGGGNRYEAYLAWDEWLLTHVVVKILRPDRARDPSALRALAAERRALEELDHPHLLRLFAADIEGDRPHLVLEFLEGPRLSTLIRRFGTLSVHQLLPLATQLCSALHYMAGSGWAHLDVKPKNIIMGAPPRLIDLSIARTIEDAARATHPIGTDAYMAPEQCRPGEAGVMAPASDIWGIGVTLYEGLAGALPFPAGSGDEGATPEERFPQLTHAPHPLPADLVPAPLAEPILACLEPRPADRPTAFELNETLQPLVAALPSRPSLSRLRPRIR